MKINREDKVSVFGKRSSPTWRGINDLTLSRHYRRNRFACRSVPREIGQITRSRRSYGEDDW